MPNGKESGLLRVLHLYAQRLGAPSMAHVLALDHQGKSALVLLPQSGQSLPVPRFGPQGKGFICGLVRVHLPALFFSWYARRFLSVRLHRWKAAHSFCSSSLASSK